jgi:FkbM family methyltransferase
MFSGLRSAAVNLGYAAIASGVRLPPSRRVSDFHQWGALIDLIGRLNVNVFLDVGANRGFFSKHLRMAGYKGRLISFEPNPEDHWMIHSFSAGDQEWSVCEYALGAKSETRQFNANVCDGETTLSSFLPLVQEIGSSRSITVQMRRLDEVLPDLIVTDVPRIFLKMDTQGYDDQVIEGTGAFLSNIVGIQSEISVVPLYAGMPHYTTSLANYERLGFALMDMFPAVRAPDGRIIEYDCIMSRNGV